MHVLCINIHYSKSIKRIGGKMKVVIDHEKHIYGLTDEQIKKIKEELTFDNPVYAQTMKYSKWGKTNVPKKLYYYSGDKECFNVPLGYSLEQFSNVTYVDDRIDVGSPFFPPFKLKLRVDQKKAKDAFINQDMNNPKGVVQLSTAKGKEQPISTTLITPNGKVKMKDIKVGDFVIGEDGKPHKVTGVYPQGIKDVYTVTFKDGTSTKCGLEHLWKIRTKNQRISSSPYQVLSLEQMLKLSLKVDGNYNLRVPLCSPVNFKHKKLPIHPYVLGALLGDGCLTGLANNKRQASIFFSNTEEDVINKVNSLVDGSFTLNAHTQCQLVYRDSNGRVKESLLAKELKKLSLDCFSHEKFIPKIYKQASIKDRIELLQGLFDTDGCVVPSGSFIFNTASETLCDDFIWLCQSLGYRATKKTHDRVGQNYGESYTRKSKEFIVRILTHDKIFSSEKHLNKSLVAELSHTNKNVNLYDDLPIVKIELTGKEECQCIMVDSEDHTYLCEGFIVTHNTITSLAIASELKTKTLIVVHKNDLVVGWQKEIDKCFGGKIESGLIKAQSRSIGDQFTIATVQTLYRMSEEELDVLFNTFTMVVHDELHHVPSTSFSISSRFNAKYKLGLSATPERNDGLTHVIHLYYGETCFKNEYTHHDKDILPVKVIIKNIGIHFEPVCISIFKNGEIKKVELKKGDYFNIKEKGDIYYRDIPRHLSKPDLHYSYVDSSVVLNEDYGNVVLNDILYEYKKGRSIVIFITQKNHCEIYYNNLASIIGEENVQLFYGDSFESDETLLNRAEERKVKITITTLSKGTEGTNVKAWEVAFLVSSINNGKGVEQAIGRIRRVKEGKINPCIVYDYRFPHVYMLANHGKTRDNRYQKMKCFIEKM